MILQTTPVRPDSLTVDENGSHSVCKLRKESSDLLVASEGHKFLSPKSEKEVFIPMSKHIKCPDDGQDWYALACPIFGIKGYFRPLNQ